MPTLGHFECRPWVTLSADPWVTLSADPWVTLNADPWVTLNADPWVTLNADPWVPKIAEGGSLTLPVSIRAVSGVDPQLGGPE